MSETRVLVVNADDFGASDGVNAGIVTAHEHGVVTSTSLMVRGAAVAAAANYARHGTLSVGLHVDLGEWSYVDGEWRPQYQVVDLEDRSAVEDELQRQLALFRELVGRKPTHLDSHQHVHRDDPLRSALRNTGQSMEIPVRNGVGIVYNGGFYGQADKGTPYPEAITVESMVSIIEGLSAPVTEVACHPASAADLDTMYNEERLTELQTLCDPRVRQAIERNDVILCGFGDLSRFLA